MEQHLCCFTRYEKVILCKNSHNMAVMIFIFHNRISEGVSEISCLHIFRWNDIFFDPLNNKARYSS